MKYADLPSDGRLIKPTASLFDLGLSDLWNYRDLLGLLVRRDFVSQYRQTILGPAWFVISPVILSFVLAFVFGQVAKVPTDGVPGQLFYLGGLLYWTYFNRTLPKIGAIFTENRNIFGKVYFPRMVIPISLCISGSFSLFLNMGVFFIFFLIYKAGDQASTFNITTALIAVPLLVVHLTLLALGCGLWLTVLSAKYRDISHMLPFIMQIWLYGSPVFYPLSVVNDQPPIYAILLQCNPITPVLELGRLGLLGTGSFNLMFYLISVAFALVVTLTGVIAFRFTERNVVDYS